MTNLTTPRALFSPVFLHSCSVIHESGSDNSFQRYGHSKFSKTAGGRILDLVQPEVGPFDPPTLSGSDDPLPRYGHSNFSKMRGRSLVGRSLVVGPQYIHCSHVLLFATLGT